MEGNGWWSDSNEWEDWSFARVIPAMKSTTQLTNMLLKGVVEVLDICHACRRATAERGVGGIQ
jgi:hypothetical protein